MEPIISPWIFYLIAVAVKLKIWLTVLIIVSLICLAFLGFKHYILEEYCGIENIQASKKRMSLISLIAVISAIVIIIVPDKETIYQMLIASYITPDNLAYFKGEITSTIDYIVNQIKQLK